MTYVFLMFLAAFCMSVAYRKTPLHPLFWFPVFMALYGCWYYLFLETAGAGARENDIVFLRASLLAMVAFAVPVAILVKARNMPGIRNSVTSRFSPNDFAHDKIIGWIFLAALAVYIGWVIITGSTSKRAIKDSLTGITAVIAALVLSGVMIMAVRSIVVHYYCATPRALPMWLYAAASVIVFLILGEREVLFGLAILWFLVNAQMKPSKRIVFFFYTCVYAGVFFAAASQGLKAAILGEIVWNRVLFESVFHSEFAAAGRNFSYLAQGPNGLITGLTVVVTELKRVVLSVVPGQGTPSMAEWFNQTYRAYLGVDGRSGWGFTLVGSGYLAGGMTGVACYFFFLGLFLSAIVNWARSSDLAFVAYLCTVPTLIYVMRQDMSYLINFYFKFALFLNIMITGSTLVIFNKFKRPQSKRS